MIHLDGPRLRARRLELGLTQREVARAIGATSVIIRTIEERGDASGWRVQMLADLLRVLAVDLDDVTAQTTTETDTEGESRAARLGALLHDHGKALPLPDIAACLSIDLATAEAAVTELDQMLRPCGMRTHHASTGICIVPDPSARPTGVHNVGERARAAGVLNAADLALLHQLAHTGVYTQTVMSSVQRRINLQKLINAGLVTEADTIGITLTPSAKRTLGIP